MLSRNEKILHLFYTTHENSDETIANKLNLSRGTVSHVIQNDLNIKIAKINKRVNQNYEIQQDQLRKSAENERLLKLVQEENKEFYSADIG